MTMMVTHFPYSALHNAHVRKAGSVPISHGLPTFVVGPTPVVTQVSVYPYQLTQKITIALHGVAAVSGEV
jgi:hypothetical protein